MAFREAWTARVAKVGERFDQAFVGIAVETERSIRIGSEITGAPGQPVDTGTLRASWIGEFLEKYRWQFTTNVPYAEIIETNARGATLRSKVGGFHSVELTRVGFPHIVSHVLAQTRDASR